MVPRGQKKLNSKTIKTILTWGNYRLNKQLMKKIREYSSYSTLAKLAVNVDLFAPILEAQMCSNVHNIIENLIETSMQLEMFY